MEDISLTQRNNKGIFFIATSQFGLAFCFNVVMSFMPFYVIRISTYTEKETIIWIGLILGLNSFIAAAAAPFWGSLTSRFSPKSLYERAFLCNALVFLLMGFVNNLPALLALRLIQGFIGGASTIGIFMVSELSPKNRLTRNLGLYQNSMTAGQLLGPPVGAYIASHIGYRAPFFFSFALVSVSLLLCHIYVIEISKQAASQIPKTTFNRGVLWGWVLSFIATIHLTFMPSILPHILQGFNLVGESALKSAGFIMMGYTATAIAGNYIISRFVSETNLNRVIATVCFAAALFQILLFIPQQVVGFAVIRMLQTGVIAVVLPLVMARFASELGGTGIGLLNSARFAGNGSGPLMATSILASANLLTLYATIAAATVGSALAFLITSRRRRDVSPGNEASVD